MAYTNPLEELRRLRAQTEQEYVKARDYAASRAKETKTVTPDIGALRRMESEAGDYAKQTDPLITAFQQPKKERIPILDAFSTGVDAFSYTTDRLVSGASFGLSDVMEKGVGNVIGKISGKDIDISRGYQPSKAVETAGNIAELGGGLFTGQAMFKAVTPVLKPVLKKIATPIAQLVKGIHPVAKVGVGIGGGATAFETARGAIDPDYADRRDTFPSKFGAGLRAGVGQTLETAGAAAQWKGQDNLAESLTRKGEAVSEGFDEAEPVEFSWRAIFDPDFYSVNVARTIPLTVSLVPAMYAGWKLGGGAATRIGLGTFGRTVVSSLGGAALSRPLESAFEAGDVYDRLYEQEVGKGKSHEEAHNIADKGAQETFNKNLALAGLDAVQLGVAFMPHTAMGGRISSMLTGKLGRGAMIAGKIAFESGSESLEEGIQYAIQQQAMGEEIDWSSPEAKESMFIGGLFGGVLGGAGVLNDTVKARLAADLPPEQKTILSQSIENKLEQGMDEEEAVERAFDELAETPEGKEAIRTISAEVASELEEEIWGQIEELEKLDTESVVDVDELPLTGADSRVDAEAVEPIAVEPRVEQGIKTEEIAPAVEPESMVTPSPEAVVDVTEQGEVSAEGLGTDIALGQTASRGVQRSGNKLGEQVDTSTIQQSESTSIPTKKAPETIEETDDIRIVDGEVYYKDTGATTAGKGKAWFTNRKSRFGGERKQIILPELLNATNETETQAESTVLAEAKQSTSSQKQSGKEPWEMTKEEYIKAQAEKDLEESRMLDYIEQRQGQRASMAEIAKELNVPVKEVDDLWNSYVHDNLADVDTYSDEESHRLAVERALEAGESIPAEVLKDYPDLAKQESGQTTVKGETDTYIEKQVSRYEEIIDNEIEEMKTEIRGVALVPSGEEGRLLRSSSNPSWYRDFWASNDRAPRAGEMRDIAIGRLMRGNTEKGMPANQEFLAIVSELSRGQQLPGEWHGLQQSVREMSEMQEPELEPLINEMQEEQTKLEPSGVNRDVSRLSEIENDIRGRRRMKDEADFEQYEDVRFKGRGNDLAQSDAMRERVLYEGQPKYKGADANVNQNEFWRESNLRTGQAERITEKRLAEDEVRQYLRVLTREHGGAQAGFVARSFKYEPEALGRPEFAEAVLICNELGLDLVPFSYRVDGKTTSIDGMLTDDAMYINVEGGTSPDAIAWHEYGHKMEGTPAYKKLYDLVRSRLLDINDLTKYYRNEYGGFYTKKEVILKEFIADLFPQTFATGEVFFTQEELVRFLNGFVNEVLSQVEQTTGKAESTRVASKAERITTDTSAPLKTLRGSRVARSKYGVGKNIGGQIYVHKNYATDVIPKDVYKRAVSSLPKDYKYNSVVYEPKTGRVRFDEAPNFDTAREPITGKYQWVEPDGTLGKSGQSGLVWHHKWQWVKDDYKGFDVGESYNWSKQWLQKITNPPGYKNKWEDLLNQHGLPLDKAPGDMQGNQARVSYSQEEMRVANATSRSAGAVGAKAITPKYVANTATKDETILDFGAGKAAAHTQNLREQGFNVTAYEFGANVQPGLHDPAALERQYDTVYASNVLNVQSSEDMLRRTLGQINSATKDGGRAVFNYPTQPRKSGLPPKRVAEIISEEFGTAPERVGGSSSSPLWEVKKGLRPGDTNTPEFRKWFGNSKVVDEQGKPLVVYHGTNKDFSVFSGESAGDKTGNPTAGWGFFFTHRPAEASSYATDWTKEGGNVMPVYVSVKNPYIMPYSEYRQFTHLDNLSEGQAGLNRLADLAQQRKKELIEQGYDGIYVMQGDYNGKHITDSVGEIVAFEPTQIKSIHNRGTWDATNPDIRYKLKRTSKESPKYTLQNPEVQERMEAAAGVPQESMRNKLAEAWDTFKRKATREFEWLPRGNEFSALRSALLNLSKQKGVAADKTLRALREITKDLRERDYSLFAYKVIFDDLAHDAAEGMLLPFGLTPETLAIEKEYVDRDVAQNERVAEAIQKRKQIWEEVKSEYIQTSESIGLKVEEKLKKEDYFRHQVLEYANAKGLSGAGGKLRTPSYRSYLRKREGSSFDINTDYLQAEFEVMAQMRFDTEIAKTIQVVKQYYDIVPKLKARAIAINNENIMKVFEEMAEQANDPNVTPESLYRKTLNKKQAMALAHLERLAARGDLPTGPNGKYLPVIDRLAASYMEKKTGVDVGEKGANSAKHNKELFEYLGWLTKQSEGQAKISALTYFKGRREKEAFIKENLAGEYVTWQDVVPEGYVIWYPREGNVFYMADSIPEQVAQALYSEALESVGVTGDMLKKVLAKGQKFPGMVVKEEVALTLDNLFDRMSKESAFAKVLRPWKQWQLISLKRIFKYNTRNLTGDLDAMIAGNPRAILSVPRAWKELKQAFFSKDNEMSPMLEQWFNRGGFETLFQAQEIYDINRNRQFRHLMDSKLKRTPIDRLVNAPKDVWYKYWDFARKSTDFREAIFRYACFIDYANQIKKSADGNPLNYGASNREEIWGLDNPLDKAFKLSNELLGAYDEVSVYGTWLADNLLPFWRWEEVNFVRYNRLINNAIQDVKLTADVGKRVSGVAGLSFVVAMKIGKFTLRLCAFSAIVTAWNMLFFADEEDDLSDDVKSRFHIIFGRDSQGNVIYFNRIGALQDYLDWVGLDSAHIHVKNLLNGRRTFKEVVTDMAKSPLTKVGTALGPHVTLPVGVFLKQKLYPDPLKPSRVRDEWEFIFDSFGLRDEYRELTGKPTMGYSRSLYNMFTYKADPGQSAYYSIKDEKVRFMKKIDKNSYTYAVMESPKSDALYNVKLAMRYKDSDAAKKYLMEYIVLGGTMDGLKRSLQSLHPLHGLKDVEKKAFILQLDSEGRENLVKAMEYYQTIINPD